MSKGKWIRPNNEYLQQIISLREQGYSWSAIGRYLKKDRTTVMYVWNRWVGRPSKTTKTNLTVIDTTVKMLASWDGDKHLCCGSQIHQQHKTDCPNVAGLWSYGNNFKDIKAVEKNKYDHLFDESKSLGKTYQQYLLKK